MRHLWPAVFALLALLSVAACYSRNEGNGPITSFTAERSKITKGMPDKLTAVFDNGIGTIDKCAARKSCQFSRRGNALLRGSCTARRRQRPDP